MMMIRMMMMKGISTGISLAKVFVGGWNLLHVTQNYEVLLHPYLLTPWSRILLEKLTGSH